MNAPILKLYKKGTDTHNQMNPNNIALSADEQINLRMAMSSNDLINIKNETLPANSARNQTQSNDAELYSMEDLFNVPIAEIHNNIYQVDSKFKVEHQKAFKYI